MKLEDKLQVTIQFKLDCLRRPRQRVSPFGLHFAQSIWRLSFGTRGILNMEYANMI